MRAKSLMRAMGGVVLAAGLALPVLLIPGIASATDVTVVAVNFDFQPENRSIKPGDRVRWRNDGDSTHAVVFTNGPSIDEDMSPGQTTQYYQFNSSGVFNYYCRYHGNTDGTGMAGRITVTSGSTASPTSTPNPTITRTITLSPTPRATRTRTSRPTATPTRTTASPSPSPTPTTASPTPTTFSPSPTPTDTSSAIAIPTITNDDPSGSSSNTQAVLAIVGVLVLGALGFLVYRRTLGSP